MKIPTNKTFEIAMTARTAVQLGTKGAANVENTRKQPAGTSDSLDH